MRDERNRFLSSLTEKKEQGTSVSQGSNVRLCTVSVASNEVAVVVVFTENVV